MKKTVKVSIAQTTITMKFEGVTIYLKREENLLLFEEAKEVIKGGDATKLEEMFQSVKEKLKKYTNQVFEVESEELFLKGDNVPVPELLAEKLVAMEAAGEDFMPLVRFWKKLRQNPSKESIKQLYGFLVHNEIPITETGDIVTEKGVTQKAGASPETLVDCYTKSIDNSIGMEVVMDRKLVNSDPTQTCSNGLHVGAPKYVRRFYSQKIIVTCLVNPKDVVSVPTDYNNTKMRVCRYVVGGYSPKSVKPKLVYKLTDFMKIPSSDDRKHMEERAKLQPEVKKNTDKVVSKKVRKNKVTVNKKFEKKAAKKIDGLSASKIVELVKKETGVVFTFNLKSKKTIVKNAIKVLANHYEARA